jgi:hypothetical protein
LILRAIDVVKTDPIDTGILNQGMISFNRHLALLGLLQSSGEEYLEMVPTNTSKYL